jgi:hypothetical protein
MTEAELADMVDRLLEVGVPPTAIGKAFSIDPFVVRDRLNGLHVQSFGAAELSEAIAGVQWLALAEAQNMIYEAPYSVRARFITAILGRTMSLTARQNPETIGNMRRDLLEFMQGGMADDDNVDAADPLTGEEIDPDAFIASAPENEDQDQGSDDQGARSH